MKKMLQIKNLSKSFGGVKAVDKCSFEVERGKITALIGPNGAGKSTLFNLISGIYKADAGRIIFDGKEITNMSPEEISNLGISRIFQHTRLFNNLTIRENLLLALDNEDTKFWKNLAGLNKITLENKEKVENILKLLKMDKFYDKRARDLSYGQKRLVELSRAILKPHKLLMLDEPVAGVNPLIRKEISSFIVNLRNLKETILLIEHDMEFTLNIADKVVVMDEGKVIAEGTPKEIRNNRKVLEAYLGD
jgi:branched-chain amino acid transport system ATP-binding protein